MSTETFELELAGGDAENRYRALRPDIETVDWDSLRTDGATPEQITFARGQWTASSLQEYATAATHALTLNLLLRARVPLDLSGMFSSFGLDEIAHAELCARVAGALGGGAPVHYQPEQVFALPGEVERPLFAAAVRLLRDCCVAETIAQAVLSASAKAATLPVLKKVHGSLARDEAAHGRFGWLFFEWAAPHLCNADRLALVRLANDELARHRGLWKALEKDAAGFSPWSVCGDLGCEGYVSAAQDAVDRLVRPGFARVGMALG